MSKIGQVLTGRDVEAAMKATIKLWERDYLAEVAEQHGKARNALPPFRSMPSFLDLTKFSEDQVPAAVIVAPGTVEVPQRRQGGRYAVAWGVGVGCVVSARDADATADLAGLYVAAVRSLVAQHATLGGFAEDTYWTGERYDELSSDDSRTIMAGIVQFAVHVPEVVDGRAGLTEPSADATLPSEEWPVAQTVTVDTSARS